MHGKKANAIGITVGCWKRKVIGQLARSNTFWQKRINSSAKEVSCPAGNRIQSASLMVGQVTIITNEHLVSAITGECHRYVFSRKTANVISGHNRGICKRLVQKAGQMLECVPQIWLDQKFMMICLKGSCHRARVRGFIKVRSPKPY